MSQTELVIATFKSSLETTKTALSEALELVAEGKSPDEAQITNLTNQMTAFQSAYIDLRGQALELSNDDDLDVDASGFHFIGYIEMKEAEVIKSRFEGLLHTLNDFLRIEADGTDYDQAIDPYRDEAKNALDYLHSLDSYVLPDGFEELCEPKKLLVDAVSLQHFDSPEGEELLNALGPIYPWKVHQGLMLHKYHFAKEEQPENDALSESPQHESETVDSVDKSDDNSSGDILFEQAAPAPAEPIENLGSENQDTEDESSVEEEILLPIIEGKAAGKVSAASFKRDLILNAPSCVSVLLPEIAVCVCIGAAQLGTLFAHMSRGAFSTDDFKSGIQYLRRRGLLTQFDITSCDCTDDDAFTLSSYACALLEKESIRNLKLGKEPYWKFTIDHGYSSFDDGLPVSFMRKRLERIEQLIACYLMSESDDSDMRFGPITGITFNDDNLRIRAEKDGQQVVFAVVGEGEEPPEDVEYSIAVTPIEEASEDEALKAQTPESESEPEEKQEVDNNCADEPATPITAVEDGVSQAIDGSQHDEDSIAFDEDLHQPDALSTAEQSSSEEVTDLHGDETRGIEETPHTEDSEDQTEDISVDARQTPSVASAALSPDKKTDDELPHKEPEGIERLLDTWSAKTATQPTDEGFVRLATYMIDHPEESKGSRSFAAIACALALLESGSMIPGYEQTESTLRQMGLATGVRVKGDDNTGSALSRVFGGFNADDEPLILSAYCRALFDPKSPYDYELWSTCETLVAQYNETFPSYPELRPLLSKLLEIHVASPTSGFNERMLDILGDRASRSIRLEGMKQRAESLIQKPAFKAKMHGLPEFNESCFGKDSDLLFCMSTIKNDTRADLDLVREILAEYQDASGQIDDAAIGDRIDTEWRAAVADKTTKGIRRLEVYARKQAIEAFMSRLTIMDEWVSYVEGSANDKSISKLGEIRKELLTILSDCASSLCDSREKRNGKEVVSFMIDSLRSRLTNDGVDSSLFDEFLLTGRVSIKDNGHPDIVSAHNSIKYFEPWRRVLYHWIEEKPSPEEAAAAIDQDGTPSSDNIRQLRNLERVLGHTAIETPLDDMASTAQGRAEHERDRFSERLEVAYAFGEIDEMQKELLQGLLTSNEESMFASEEFGLWKQLIAALNRQISDMSASQGRQLAARLERCEQTTQGKTGCELLTQARIQLTEARNFAVVEEYLNRFEAGESKLPEGYSEEDSFAEFISDDVYGPLLEACQRGRSQQFTRFAKQYVREHYPSNWTSRQKENSEQLISSWPCSSKKKPEPSTIAQLFLQLGLNIKGAWKTDTGREHYLLEVKPEKRNQSDYTHPISMFGTQARSPLDVIVLHGNQSAREIVNHVSSARVNGMSIVVVDGCLSLQTRRQVAEIFHTSKSKISPFLLIDQVLALHLALHEKTERLPILLKCTLPFTYYQPFIRDGGATADEMFSGRESELRTIIDPRGATVVYGGRQLGKTALLERAEGLQHDPDNGRYAVLVNIQQCAGEEEFVDQVIRTVNRKTDLNLSPAKDIEGLCDEIQRALAKESVRFVLLLIDEADCFLDSISGADYMPIKPLVDLKRERSSEFKFVLAGLHNVVRYKNATANNGIFGQLGSPLCVKPLKPADALRLMSRPLGYLGFDVKRYPHIETILTNTNYYPGILQFFGYELVDTMTKQYGQYYQASLGNPPYGLTQEQLGSIMSSRRLNDSIKDKFLLSLQLDPRYMALARCVALLTQEREGDTASELSGLSAAETLDCGRDWNVKALEKETVKTTELLMDEMVDMGILSKGDSEAGGYRLRMHRFLSIIGSADSILEAFISDEED